MPKPSRLSLRYVPLEQAVCWDWLENPKAHDIGGIAESIRRYGFRDPPEYDVVLQAFVQGNGRVQALAWLWRQEPEARPRYIGLLPDGGWAVPVLFGADSDSVAAAQAYAIDANSLVVTGGDSEIWDILRLYEKQQLAEVVEFLGQQGQELVSLDPQAMHVAGKSEDDPKAGDPAELLEWKFQVYFQGTRELLDELELLLGPYFVPRTRTKIIPEVFAEMVRGYCRVRGRDV